ncbi:hypothetical protein PR202_gb19951 [Eleusine coracana subsp. coracana]|uniref:Uncharacterized protein n=1 Tax=Eleusine coracana subsp. coracana TaxID=191504 RepID=A0AAV5FB14_ELECO|nr:hypothetical protein PR202_gb19951 [Eleusine coracana subsp. coracana]
MELLPWVSILAAVVLATALMLVTTVLNRRSKLNKYKLPPGPRPWPVIGNLNLIGPLPQHSLHKLSAQYGPLMSLRFGFVPVVVGSSVDAARSILKTNDLAFIDRPRTAAGKYTSYNIHHAVVAVRRLLAPGEEAVADRAAQHEAAQAVRAGASRGGERDAARPARRGIVYRSCGGAERPPDDGQPQQKVLDEHNERRQREGEAFVARDMVDKLLQLADDPNLKVPITRDGVKAFTLELFAAGTDTSAATVEWAMTELVKKPAVLTKATEELDRVVGRNRLVAEGDIPNLPYFDAIVKETMRTHPVAPLLTPRQSREDTSIDGYDIPAGTRVLINIMAICRDPKVWDAPMEFRPERFIGSSVDVRGQDLELLPFGSGRRMCPGHTLGLKMVQVTLANLLHAFHWKLPDGMVAEELSMEEVFRMNVLRKVPLEAVAEPKLPAHLYAGP